MNELKTTGLGGLPFALDDLRFVYVALKQALNGVSNAFSLTNVDGLGNPQPVKLWGCTITTDIVSAAPLVKYSVSEGFISMGGEIFYVPATFILANAGDTIYFVISESYDPAGELTFADQSVQNVYKVRNATISASNAGSAYYIAIANITDIRSLIRKNIHPVWTPVDTIDGGNIGGDLSIGYDGINYFLRFDLTFSSSFNITSQSIQDWHLAGFGVNADQASLFVNRSFPVTIERDNSTPLLGILHIGVSIGSTPTYYMNFYTTEGALWSTSFADSGFIRGLFQVTYN
jgi:hypothetical protein